MTAARKWGPWVLLIAVAAALLVLGLPGGGRAPTLDARVQHISAEVRCPVCHGETVAQSQAAPSVEIRNQIRADLQKGRSEAQILASLVAAYGPGILEKPQARGVSLLVWVVPVVAVILGALGLLLAFRRWRATGEGRPLPSPETASGSVPEAVPATAPPAAASEQAEAPSSAPRSTGRHPSRRSKIIVSVTGVALVAGGASWAVAASAGTRLPGQEITGQVLSSEAEAAALQTAQADENRNDAVDAVKEYQKVLDSNPRQVQALTGEGWLLAQTGQPALLKQGLAMLQNAEAVQPGYAPPHLYRGLALFGEGDYSDSIPELQWYLGHSPDPKLASGVQATLQQAETKAAAAGSG